MNVFSNFIGVWPQGGSKYMQMLPQGQSRKTFVYVTQRKKPKSHTWNSSDCVFISRSEALWRSSILQSASDLCKRNVDPATMSTILHYDIIIINKTSERLPTVKPKHLFCPLQVSGREVHHRTYPDCLHHWRSSPSIPAGRRTIRLKQTVSTPVTACSTRLMNTSTFYELCSLYLPW